jgi:16S rRNA (guanine527-N7)-methyltransferase
VDIFAPVRAYAAAESLALTDQHYTQMASYLELLREWNEKFNLTAITDPEQMVSKHVLDALTYLAFWSNPPQSIIDVGAGAGIPGIILAMVWPETQITLVESIGKKCTFMRHVATELNLSNVTVVNDRAESIGHDPAHREHYQMATARAVADLRTLVEYLLPLCRPQGVVYAPKGPHPEEEVAGARVAIGRLGGRVRDVVPIVVAGLDGRSMVRIDKLKATPAEFPRAAGVPSKRPL